MLAHLLTTILITAAPAPLTVDSVYKQAAQDLATVVPQPKRAVTRYLSLHTYKPEDRSKIIQSLDFTVNSLSWKSNLIRPVTVGDDEALYRIDLEELGWDYASRVEQRAEWERRGVKFAFKDAAEEQRFLNPWEALAKADPYFRSNTFKAEKDGSKTLVRGWIDPIVENSTRHISYSANFVIRADWFLSRVWVEKERGGFYSLFLMFPPNEKDLYKIFLVPIDTVERATQLRFGGAVAQSVVAFHNRGLEMFASFYGHGPKFIWRTYDFLNDNVLDKNIYDALGGTLKHDGREIIGSLPNGLHWYYLSKGNGEQVEVVPQQIALDMRRDITDRDRNVINAIKCVSCHGPVNGIQPYDDVIAKAALTPGIGLVALSHDKARALGRAYDLTDYYKLGERGGLAGEIIKQQDSYSERIFAVNNLTSTDNAKQVVGWYDRYVYQLVNLDQAAMEMGATVAQARITLARDSGSNPLVVLSSGQPIGRAQWESVFAAAMRAQSYPWDKELKK